MRLIELGGGPAVEQAKLTRKERHWLVNRIGFLDRVNRGNEQQRIKIYFTGVKVSNGRAGL